MVRNMPEHARYLRGMFAWAGFRQVPMLYDRGPRFAGETHYPLRKMLRLAANGVLSFSEKPLLWPLWMGLLWLVAGFALLIALIVLLLLGRDVSGLVMPLLVCLASGSLLSSLGVLGAYLARVYEEAKGRPLYVVASTRGFEAPAPQLPPGTRRKA